MHWLQSPKAILFHCSKQETFKKDGSIYEVEYKQLRMKRQPVPWSLLDRVVKRFASFEIYSSSPFFLGVAYFFDGFPQKTFGCI